MEATGKSEAWVGSAGRKDCGGKETEAIEAIEIVAAAVLAFSSPAAVQGRELPANGSQVRSTDWPNALALESHKTRVTRNTIRMPVREQSYQGEVVEIVLRKGKNKETLFRLPPREVLAGDLREAVA